MSNNVFERVQRFNEGRDPHLLQLKYQAMRTSAFAFLRGTDHLFYEDWPRDSPLNNAPLAWLCGDLHWQNLGSYKGDNRLVYFQINDFDEAVLAPCTWDLARLLVSFLLSAPVLKARTARMEELCTLFLDTYVCELEKGRIHFIEEEATTGLVKALLFQVKTRPRQALLDEFTTHTDTRRVLTIDGKRTNAVTAEERAHVMACMEQWGVKQINPSFYKVLDVAHRIAGIGSLGLDRYVMLVEGKGSPDYNYLLDLKAEPASSLQPYLITKQPEWSSEAERVTTTQRWMQGMPPALLAPVLMNSISYVLRELQPQEDKVNTELLHGKVRRLEKLVRVLAQVVAWSQLRSGGRQGAAASYEIMSFATKKRWRTTLLAYAKKYAIQVEEDYKEFCAAHQKSI